MKAIDLYIAIRSNKEVPNVVFYNFEEYQYYPDEKEYYRDCYGDMISLFLDANQEDIVYVKEFPKEDKKIEKLNIEIQDERTGNAYIRNEYGTKCYLTKHSKIIANKLNELIDYITKAEEK